MVRPSSFTHTQIPYTRNQQSLHSRSINLFFRWPHYAHPPWQSSLSWMRASSSLWSVRKFLLFIYFSPWVQGLLMIGYFLSPHVTLWVLRVAPAFQELAKHTIISFVGCSHGFRLKDLWSDDHPTFTKGFFNGPTASFKTDGCEPPVNEGKQSFYLINKRNKNVRLK
jgi:hypothetical protein